jgi:glycosyltransferase involved in cell wall biosynthesis
MDMRPNEESKSCSSGDPPGGIGTASRADARANRRVLFVSHTCYFDTSNGASVASRALMECLARHGFAAAAMTGTVLDSRRDVDPAMLLSEQGLAFEALGERDGLTKLPPDSAADPTAYRLHVRGVAVVLHKSPTTRPHVADEHEQQGFLRLLEQILERSRPDVVVTYGGDALAAEIRRRAGASGAAIVFALHNFNYNTPAPFIGTDAVVVPSRFAASYYFRTLGLKCTPLPYLIDFERVRATSREPLYVTFVNPSYEKGVYVFARLADELGRRRPDIPLLVVEGRGTEQTLVECGPDLRAHGNVFVMSHTTDPRHFWGVTRLCVMPSLWWENQPLVAVEAMVNGVPVLGSDRGGIPEALGDGGIVLNLPSRLTPWTRDLPTPAQMDPWIKAIIGLCDDPAWYAEQSRRAVAETRRWSPEVLEPQYVRFFESLRPSTVFEADALRAGQGC